MLKRRSDKIKQIAKQRQEGLVILEDIYDPHNAAAVLRTCEAFGIQKVAFVFDKQKKFNPKKIGKATSSSANKWLDFFLFNSVAECIRTFKKQGYTIYATTLNQTAKPLAKTKFQNKKTALMFGNEHSGLSEAAVNLSDAQIYIPMQGFVQSMNLSVTAAICIYELARQRQNSKGDFLLPKKESTQLIKAWLKK